jgi:hypothetical protein
MTTSQNIHNLISAYLKTKDLEALAASFAELFYDIEDTTPDPTTLQLAYDVESALAAMTAGVCSEDAFYEAMKSQAPSLSVNFFPISITVSGDQVVSDFPASTTAAAETPVTLLYVGTAPSVGFGPTKLVPSTDQTNTSLLQSPQYLRA